MSVLLDSSVAIDVLRGSERARVFGALRLVSCGDLEIWRRARQHMKYYHPSHGLDDMDALIAATAEHHGLKLATLNVKHFPMLKGLRRAY